MTSQTLKLLAGRAAGIGLAAVLAALEKGSIPHDVKGVLALGGIALAAIVAKSPDLFAAAGIIRPLSPGQLSLYQKALSGVTTLIHTPAAKRRQKAEQDVQAILTNPQTLQILRSRLWQTGDPVPAGALAPAAPVLQEAPTVGPTSSPTVTEGDAEKADAEKAISAPAPVDQSPTVTEAAVAQKGDNPIEQSV